MITRFYRFTLNLNAPLLLTTLEGDPNSVRSLGFIPGSAIRGIVAGKLDPLNNFQTFRTLILSGQVCYLNAYPVVNTLRSLPTPISWRAEKYVDQNLDLAAYSGRFNDDSDPGDVWPEAQLKELDVPFLSLDQAGLTAGVTSVVSRVHQQRDRPKGKAYTHTDPKTGATEERGTIFTYEALEPRQLFRGALAISGNNQPELDARLNEIQAALGDKVYLGRSRRARYGGEAIVSALSLIGVDGKREAEGRNGLINNNIGAGTRFRAYLSADYVGRDEKTGQIDPASFTHEITNSLAGRAKPLWSRWAFRLVGGYNRTWGLQLPQVLTLRAGSVLVLEALQPISLTDFLAIEQRGLGERRAEGFGRVLFLEDSAKNIGAVKSPSASYPPRPSVTVPALIGQMQERILMDAVARRIAEVAADITGSALPRQIPSPSLLGRLRSPLRGGTADPLTRISHQGIKPGA